jgi:hypothetical protein
MMLNVDDLAGMRAALRGNERMLGILRRLVED